MCLFRIFGLNRLNLYGLLSWYLRELFEAWKSWFHEILMDGLKCWNNTLIIYSLVFWRWMKVLWVWNDDIRKDDTIFIFLIKFPFKMLPRFKIKASIFISACGHLQKCPSNRHLARKLNLNSSIWLRKQCRSTPHVERFRHTCISPN